MSASLCETTSMCSYHQMERILALRGAIGMLDSAMQKVSFGGSNLEEWSILFTAKNEVTQELREATDGA
jgi:hypothetical protein